MLCSSSTSRMVPPTPAMLSAVPARFRQAHVRGMRGPAGTRGRVLLGDRREPARVAVVLAVDGGEELALDLLGDRAPAVGGDGPVVDLLDRADLGGGSREERLVGEVQIRSDEVLLVH